MQARAERRAKQEEELEDMRILRDMDSSAAPPHAPEVSPSPYKSKRMSDYNPTTTFPISMQYTSWAS